MADNVTINVTEVLEPVTLDVTANTTAVTIATTETVESVSINIVPVSNLVDIAIEETPVEVTINVSEYDASLINAITLELEMTNRLFRYKEFTYSGGDISNKSIYTDNTKTTKIFNVDFTYNVGGDLTGTETTRVSDGFVFNKEFNYNGSGDLININIT